MDWMLVFVGFLAATGCAAAILRHHPWHWIYLGMAVELFALHYLHGWRMLVVLYLGGAIILVPIIQEHRRVRRT